MIGYVIGLIGIWYVQDSLASICYYPNEKWRWNHAARVVRCVWGIALIVIGGILYV